MGFNTVVVVMNDAIDTIKRDKTFGQNFADAVSKAQNGKQHDVPAYSESGLGVFANAATVLSTEHADVSQVAVIRGNSGYVHRYGEVLPDKVLDDLKYVLEQHGYSVRRKPKRNDK